MTQNVFSEGDSNTGDTVEVSTTNLVDQLVGEGKKFQTIEDLARGKKEADDFINQLKDENAAIRSELSKLDNAEATFEELRKQIEELKAKKNPEPSPDTKGVLTEDDVKALIRSSITESEKERTLEQNVAVANEGIIKAFGDATKAKEAVANRAVELGLSVSDLQSMAAKSPSAFLSVMGLNQTQKVKPDSFPKSDVNTNRFETQNKATHLKEGSRAWFNEKRREMGRQAFFSDTVLMRKLWDAKNSGAYDS